MSKIKERVSKIEGEIPHLAGKSDLSDMEARLTHKFYGLAILVVLGVVSGILWKVL